MNIKRLLSIKEKLIKQGYYIHDDMEVQIQDTMDNNGFNCSFIVDVYKLLYVYPSGDIQLIEYGGDEPFGYDIGYDEWNIGTKKAIARITNIKKLSAKL